MVRRQSGRSGPIRTGNLVLVGHLLYVLSYAPIKSVLSGMNEAFQARVEKYFLDYVAHDSPHSRNPFVTTHCRRYVNSMMFVAEELRTAKVILEVGAPGAFTEGLRLLFPELVIENSTNDLRTVFTDKVDYYDMILNMEVIEHMKDLDMSEDWFHRDAYVGDGLKNFVNTCYQCLKPGGKMFLTTPNLSSLGTLWRVMNCGNPFSYALHIRELSVGDLWQTLTSAGFQIERFTTMDCYDAQVPALLVPRLIAFLKELGCKTDNREQVQFALAVKPVVKPT